MGVGSREEGRAVFLWIFIRDTDKVEGDLMEVNGATFYSWFFPLPPFHRKFSADNLERYVKSVEIQVNSFNTSYLLIHLVTLLRPGDSEVTFSIFESSCHLLPPV